MLKEFSNEIADVVAAAAPSVVQVNGGRRPASGLSYAAGIVITTTRALGREQGLQVRQHDGRKAICIWEAGSIETLKTYLDPMLGPDAHNQYFEVVNKEGIALPTMLQLA